MRQRFNHKHEEIMILLARYQMLTYQHLIDLGIDKHKSNLYKYLKPLRQTRSNLVDSMYITDDHAGRDNIKKEVMFYLTPKGVKFLVDELEMKEELIKYPKGKRFLLTTDTHHRKQFISCAIKAFEDCEILWHDFYYEQDNRRRKTRIDLDKGYIESDMLFLAHKNKPYLYAMEYERKPDIKRIVEKLEQYMYAIAQGQPATYLVAQGKMQKPRDIAVLYIFEDEKKMHSVIDRLKQNPSIDKFKNNFFFKSFEVIGETKFPDHWLNIYKQRVSMY